MKRIRTSEGNEGVSVINPQEGIPDINEELISQSCEGDSTISLPEAVPSASRTDEGTYLSFEDGISATPKRISIAAFKHRKPPLDGDKLCRRLRALPAENEYVPRKPRDRTPTPCTLATTRDTTPTDYRGTPAEEVEIESERIRMRNRKRLREGRGIWAI